ncbi:M42 family metallopeptidase [soil metagenome]
MRLMDESQTAFFKSLLAAPGPSGFEAKPARVWRDEAARHGAEVRSDHYGNAFAAFAGHPSHGGGRPRVMLAGHIDEIGLIVTYVSDEGLLHFKGIGGWDSQQLVGQRVRVVGYRAELMGVIGKKPIHLISPDDRKKVSKLEDLWIDIGARDAKEAKEHVRIGDYAVIEGPYLELLNGRVVSKAVDNRIGAYIVLEAARRAKAGSKTGAEVVAVATVQEEIGGVGAYTASFGLQPDVAVAVDVTHATDQPGVDKKQEGDSPLGSGPVITLGAYAQRAVADRLIRVAEEGGIPYTLSAAPSRTGTDADAIARNHSGVPTGVVSIPNRYMHSANEMIDLQDLENVVGLLASFCDSLDEGTTFRLD